MSIFDRLDQVVSGTVDVINADPFILMPQMQTPNGRPALDPTRPIVGLLVPAYGVFDYISEEYGIQLGVRKSYREANDLRALQTGRDPRLSIDRKYFPTPDVEPKQGDKVKFPTFPVLPIFSVVSCQRDGLSRLELLLVHEGSQA